MTRKGPGATLERQWLRRGPLAWALWPVSLVFGLLSGLHRKLYRLGVLQRQRLRVPVIVVGNVVAGGAGKTPVVMALVEHLRARGLAAGVVSRGYGRNSVGCLEVTGATAPSDAGDEPLLIARRCQVPVFVAARRAEAGRALLNAYPRTQVIVADDGLQHHALERDIEICVFDDRGAGNGWLLPAGPLRESWPRPVDLVLSTSLHGAVRGHAVRRLLADQAVRADGQRIALDMLRGQPCDAVAGIARPEAFFDMLRVRGFRLRQTSALPDHYDFNSNISPMDGRHPLICTEKDAVKLWRIQPAAWAVPLVLQIDAAFWTVLDSLLDAKLSSTHGSETA